MLESCFQRLFGVIRHVEFTFHQIGGGTVCNLRFFSFSVAGVLAIAFEIMNRNCAKKVLCYRKTDTSVYEKYTKKKAPAPQTLLTVACSTRTCPPLCPNPVSAPEENKHDYT